jgi:hypothetical protein
MLKDAPALPGTRRHDKRDALSRIRAMSFSEVAYRSRQEAVTWLERVARIGSTGAPEALLADRAPMLATGADALRVLRTLAPARFFAGTEDLGSIEALRQRFPGDCAALVRDATDSLLRHDFNLLGYRNLSFGDPIDWHFDPVWGRQSPHRHWSQIDPLDPEVVGDSKIVWELNRHQWIVQLAQAWALTGDDRYAQGCIDAIDGWLEANPPGTGINWASSLEVAMRLMSWSWTLVLLRDVPWLSGEWLMKVLAAIWVHAEHVRRHLSFYFSPNTHLTAEALGLIYAGTLWPEFLYSARWRRCGTEILIAESERQIAADGVHFELSTCYHRYTIEIYLHFLLIAERNHITIPPVIADRVGRMVEFLLAVRQPDGSIPSIGDADGGALLPLTRRSPQDGRGVFALAAALFQRPEFAWASEGLTPEVFWLLGAGRARTFESVDPAPPPGQASRVFPAGGYAIMRSGWDAGAHQMIVDVGQLGCPVSSGHGHADLLSVQCAVFGEPCLVDPGTYCYTPEVEWRDFFRSTAAHSTIVVDGRSQAEPTGPFGWDRRPQGRLREWHSTADLDFLDAESNAFLTLPDPVLHRRRVLFVKPRYWVIVDDLTGVSSHRVDLTFQCSAIQVTPGPNRWARARTAGGRSLWISPFASGGLRLSVRSGETTPIRGWISPDYGQRYPAPALTYTSRVALPWRVLTLLFPDIDDRSTPPAVRLIYDEDGLPSGLIFDPSGDSVRVDERAIVVERS